MGHLKTEVLRTENKFYVSSKSVYRDALIKNKSYTIFKFFCLTQKSILKERSDDYNDSKRV